jgi:NADH dehydrogenase FAD-containing subunit
MEPRDARGGVLILGGGFAGAYVARLLGDVVAVDLAARTARSEPTTLSG